MNRPTTTIARRPTGQHQSTRRHITVSLPTGTHFESINIKVPMNPNKLFIQASTPISPACIDKAGILWRIGPASATALFFVMLFVAFYFGVKMILWTKGVPTLASERGQFEQLNADLRRLEIEVDPTLHPHPEPEEIYVSPQKWIYTPVPGNRFLKGCKGFSAMVLIGASHIMMYRCILNIDNCPRHTLYATTFSSVLTFQQLLRAINVCSVTMSMVGITCLAKLIVDPFLIKVWRRELAVDIFFLQNYIFMMGWVYLWVGPLTLLDILMRVCFLGGLFERIGGPPMNLYHIELVMELWRRGCVRLDGRRPTRRGWDD